jgi:hypothetical protein
MRGLSKLPALFDPFTPLCTLASCVVKKDFVTIQHLSLPLVSLKCTPLPLRGRFAEQIGGENK